MTKPYCMITNKHCPTPKTECSKCHHSKDAKLPDWAMEELHNNRRKYLETFELPLEDFLNKLGAIPLT